jgi:hypothetical protein
MEALLKIILLALTQPSKEDIQAAQLINQDPVLTQQLPTILLQTSEVLPIQLMHLLYLVQELTFVP